MEFTIENIVNQAFYEYRQGKRIFPVYIIDKLPTCLRCKNMDTEREIMIRTADIPKRIKAFIPNLSEWRLHNGD